MRVIHLKFGRLCRSWRRVCCFLSLVMVIYVYMGWSAHSCSPQKSLELLEALCQEYREGNAAGNLCVDLCTNHAVQFQHCTNYAEGKKIMIVAWNGRTTVLKSKRALLKDYYPISYEGQFGLEFPEASEFANIVKRSIEQNMFAKVQENGTRILTRMWSLDFDGYLEDNQIINPHQSAMTSIWALIQQDEYLLMKYFQGSPIMPQIYGSCGHIYMTEFAPPGVLSFDVTGSISKPQPWPERAAVALKLLDLLKVSEEDFHDSLHYCDVKGENFGLSWHGQVKAIDVDSVFFSEHLRIQLSDPNCTTHSECDFFDCKGFCDVPRKKCTNQRINDNLQTVCQKIFQSSSSNAFDGLLKHPPVQIRDQLESVVARCASPGLFVGTDIPIAAGKDLHNRLYRLLRDSLHGVEGT